MAIISAIVAVSDNDVIGKDNALLWHIPEDFKHFKRSTMAKPLIMGRKTFESLPGVLPGRPHIIITRSTYTHEGVTVAHSINEAIAEARKLNDEEVFIIGGAEVYKQTRPLWDRLYLTRVHRDYEGDAFFPTIDPHEWQVFEEENLEHEGLFFSILKMDRLKK